MSFAVFGHRSLYRFTVVFVFVRAWSFHFFSIQQGTNEALSSPFESYIKQEIPRFTPYFQRSIVGFYLVRWKGLEPPAY